MFAALGLGKFYGGSLPRPRLYADVKLNSERVDPPVSVTDPLMAWANEAHWAMGGLSLKRLRLQGRIEGKVDKLRTQRESGFKASLKRNSGRISKAPSKAAKRKRKLVKGGGAAVAASVRRSPRLAKGGVESEVFDELSD